MDDIREPKLRFYLERRNLIDEWARLADLEPAVANQFLLSLTPDLEQLAAAAGEDVELFSGDINGEPTLGLTRRRWAVEGEYPRFVVGMAWSRRVRFNGPNGIPWLGLRVRKSGAHAELHSRVSAALVGRPIDPSLDHRPPKSATPWLVWRWAPCKQPEFWDDLTPYREELLAGVQRAWDDLVPMVDPLVP